MSRVGKYIDNGPMENFWGILNSKRYYLKGKYRTYEDLEFDIKDYIRFYIYESLQKRLDSMALLNIESMLLSSI